MNALYDAMLEVGIDTPPAKEKPTSSGFIRWGKNNRYWMKRFDGGVIFGDYSTEESHAWFEDNDKPLDAGQIAIRREKFAALRKEREEDEAREHAETAIKALNQWQTLTEEGVSPYLQNKRVGAFGVRFDDTSIVVPLYDAEGKLWSLQTIKANGDKRFLYQGRKKGCFCTIGQIDGEVYIAEGYSTAASVHMATGVPVVIAFDADNLEPVIEVLKAKDPALKITIAADDDRWKTEIGNKGRIKANAAAKRFGCTVALPWFKNTDSKPTDFNDLHVLEGLDKVKLQLQGVFYA